MTTQPKQLGTLSISSQFCGPPRSANGGYAAGAVAGFLSGDAETTLRKPPPLDTPMVVVGDNEEATVLAGDVVVAEARRKPCEVELPLFATWEQALEAERDFPWSKRHPYPTCFVCGPQRTTGDGLRIFPGTVHGTEIAAATWVPHEAHADRDGLVPDSIIWSALDCPSYLGILASTPSAEAPVLLGRLGVHIEVRPRVGENWVAMGWLRSLDGRKQHAGAALVRDDGVLGAYSAATWITLN